MRKEGRQAGRRTDRRVESRNKVEFVAGSRMGTVDLSCGGTKAVL